MVLLSPLIVEDRSSGGVVGWTKGKKREGWRWWVDKRNVISPEILYLDPYVEGTNF